VSFVTDPVDEIKKLAKSARMGARQDFWSGQRLS